MPPATADLAACPARSERPTARLRDKIVRRDASNCSSGFGALPLPRGEGWGEGVRSIDGAKPLTRIAKAIRPLPMGKVRPSVGRRHPSQVYQAAFDGAASEAKV